MYASTLRFAAQAIARYRAFFSGVAITTLLITAAHASDLVTNGDFSLNGGAGQLNSGQTSITGWSTTGYNFLLLSSNPQELISPADFQLPNDVTSNGFNFIAADGYFDAGPITQTVTGLNVGDTYDLTFDWAATQQVRFTGASTDDWQVTLGSSTQTTSGYNLSGNGDQDFSGWQSESMNFTATSTSEVLSFLAKGSADVPPFLLVENVSLTDTSSPSPSPVPEMQTWSLLATGLLAGAGLFKSRRWLQRKQQVS